MKINKEFRKKEKLIKKYEKEKKKELELQYILKIKKCKICCTLYFYLIIERNSNNLKIKKVFFNIDDVEKYLKKKVLSNV